MIQTIQIFVGVHQANLVPTISKSQPFNKKMQFYWINMAMYRFGLSTESYNTF
jgi:hypothetical protein